MSVNLSPVGGAGAQFFDNNGSPLSGGKLYSYSASTTTPAATYTSIAGTFLHTNPIVLNAGGRVPDTGEIWLADNVSYKFVLKTSADALVATWDNVNGINSNFVNYTVQEEIMVATADQTVFDLTTITYTPATNSLSVFVDGVNQILSNSYVETDSNTVTFVSGLHVGAEVKFTTAIPATGTATDASVVSYTPAGTGAVATTVQAKLRESVSVLDFGADPTGVADSTAAIQAAITAVANGGEVFIPAGVYSVLPDQIVIDKANIVLVGEGGMGYGTLSPNIASTLKFSAGGFGIKFDDYANNEGSGLRNLKINGNGVLQAGVQLEGMILLDNVDVHDCTIYGFYLYDFCAPVIMRNISAVRISDGAGNGIGIYSYGATNSNTTHYVDNFVIRGCDVGLRINNGHNLAYTNGVIESNRLSAIKIYKTAVDATSECRQLLFRNVWMEYNNTTDPTGYDISIDSASPASFAASDVVFDHCNIVGPSTNNIAEVIAVNRCTFDACRFGDGARAVEIGENAYGVVVKDREGGTVEQPGTPNGYNTELTTKLSGMPGFSQDLYWLGRAPAMTYKWDNWTATDAAGTLTSAGTGTVGAGTTGATTAFTSASNVSGTVTVTFAVTGRYVVHPWISLDNTVTYSAARCVFDLSGGTATINSNDTSQIFYGVPTDGVPVGGIPFMLYATAGQTLSILPKIAATSGGAGSNHIGHASFSIQYLGT